MEDRIPDLPLLLERKAGELQRASGIAGIFNAVVARQPDATAVEFEGLRLSYAELNARANRLAHYLISFGVVRGECVALRIERSSEMIVALLGILKAGAAYLPLDSAYPAERIQGMLAIARPAIVLTKADLERDFTMFPDTNPGITASCEDLAYVMFTSGSTGAPKGVEVPQRGVVRLVCNVNYMTIRTDDTFLQLAPISFDASTFEIWGALLNGAKLVVFPAHAPTFVELGTLLREQGISILWLTASLFREMADTQIESLTGVRQLLAGGDVLPLPQVRRVLAHLRPGAVLINGYGPTENTTFTCCHSMSAGDQIHGPVPIGRPISNTQVYVLDEHFQPVPNGQPGELYVGGDGLARGYLGDPALTAQKFISTPFAGRLYRSGDRVRYRPDGALEFLGRLDNQVKIRGYRVEPGEVEAILSTLPDWKEAAVVAQDSSAGEKVLVAFMVPKPNALDPSMGGLRDALREHLPDYMIPARFVVLDRLPLDANGKVDRNALREIGHAPANPETYAEAQSALETQLVQIWEEFLGVTPIGIHDDYFNLGGNSLLAARIFERFEKITGIKVPLDILLHSPSIAQIASYLQQDLPDGTGTSVCACRSEGSSSPIYAVHGIGGTVLTFRRLAYYLPRDRPVYCLKAPSQLDGSWNSLEELAALYVRDIREFQQEGPYHLIGGSFGGMVVFEMARQFHEQGCEVGFLGLIDSYNMGRRNLGSRTQRIRLQLQFLASRARAHRKGIQDRRWTEWPGYLGGRMLAMGRLTQRNLWRLVFHVFGSRKKGLPVPFRNMRRVFESAGMEYIPKKYAGEMTLFIASDEPQEPSGFNQLGWAGLAEKGVTIIKVAGDHETMMNEPHVRVLGSKITQCMAEYTNEVPVSSEKPPAAGCPIFTERTQP